MWVPNGTVTRLSHLSNVYCSRNYTASLPQLQRVGRHIIQEKAWEDTNTLSSNRSVAIEMCFPGTFQRQNNPECTYRRQELIRLNRLYLPYLELCATEQSIFPSGHTFYLVSFPKTYCTVRRHTQFTSLLFTSIICVLYRAIISSLFVCLWRDRPLWARVSSFMMFLDHTQRRITFGRTPLDEWSARPRDPYLTTHDTHSRQTSMRRWNSNPQSQQASCRIPTPYTAWPLGPAIISSISNFLIGITFFLVFIGNHFIGPNFRA